MGMHIEAVLKEIGTEETINLDVEVGEYESVQLTEHWYYSVQKMKDNGPIQLIVSLLHTGDSNETEVKLGNIAIRNYYEVSFWCNEQGVINEIIFRIT